MTNGEFADGIIIVYAGNRYDETFRAIFIDQPERPSRFAFCFVNDTFQNVEGIIAHFFDPFFRARARS